MKSDYKSAITHAAMLGKYIDNFCENYSDGGRPIEPNKSFQLSSLGLINISILSMKVVARYDAMELEQDDATTLEFYDQLNILREAVEEYNYFADDSIETNIRIVSRNLIISVIEVAPEKYKEKLLGLIPKIETIKTEEELHGLIDAIFNNDKDLIAEIYKKALDHQMKFYNKHIEET